MLVCLIMKGKMWIIVAMLLHHKNKTKAELGDTTSNRLSVHAFF